MKIFLPILVLAVSVPIVAASVTRAKLARPSGDSDACRSQVTARSSVYEIRTIDSREHLFVFVQVDNRAGDDISDPVIRVEVLDGSGTVKDTFIRTVYGARIPPGETSLLRVDADTTLTGSSITVVRASIEDANCKYVR